MKLHLIDRSSSTGNIFSTVYNHYPYFLKVWHYHPELELVVILKSTGTRFIGDSIEKFKIGEIVLIGKNVPHMWLNDDIYFKADSHLMAEAIGVHFREDFLGQELLKAPEMKLVAEMIHRAQRGIKFSGNHTRIVKKIREIHLLTGMDKVIAFLQIMDKLSKIKNYTLLSSEGFMPAFGQRENKQHAKVYEYIFKNFTGQITLNEVAAIANMQPSSFSRFFKRINHKTFKTYLNELRIGYACKLLLENNKSIAQVCYESGFNNISNFNRQFRQLKQCSPREYLKNYKKRL
ncbi:MAG: AraC family transcriptional regulator [Flavobacteriaceae bacterium]